MRPIACMQGVPYRARRRPLLLPSASVVFRTVNVLLLSALSSSLTISEVTCCTSTPGQLQTHSKTHHARLLVISGQRGLLSHQGHQAANSTRNNHVRLVH